jgi:hypothetical protein
MTDDKQLLIEYIEISRQMSIKHEEARNQDYTSDERSEAQIEYYRLQEVLLQVEWKLEAV